MDKCQRVRASADGLATQLCCCTYCVVVVKRGGGRKVEGR